MRPFDLRPLVKTNERSYEYSGHRAVTDRRLSDARPSAAATTVWAGTRAIWSLVRQRDDAPTRRPSDSTMAVALSIGARSNGNAAKTAPSALLHNTPRATVRVRLERVSS